MGEKAANGQVIDALPVARAEVGGEVLQVAAVGFNGVRRSIALAQ